MATLVKTPQATGKPGIPPRWTHSAKEAVGTAYSLSSRVWFTVSGGVLSEIYYPTIDSPQVRDLQFLVSDGETFFHAPHRDMDCSVSYAEPCGLAVRIVNCDRQQRYSLVIDVIANPQQPCLLLNARLEGDPAMLRTLHVYVLLAPHLNSGGWGNSANTARIAGREFLTANKNGAWLAMGADVPFARHSCGYVGTSDGWTDLANNFRMDYQFAAAPDGNVAMTGELALSDSFEFTLGLGFGRTLHRAVTSLFQSLSVPFSEHFGRFREQWRRECSRAYPIERWASDGGRLYHKSRELLLAHEDKTYAGAIIASLSIPWGEAKGDDDLGGYHLVWTRDMVNSATGLLATGNLITAERALIYLACSQQADGGFPQNFWIDGQPYWPGVQLDEVAFPIILAWRLEKAGAIEHFDHYPMVRAAARYLITHGPATPQERWEENSGYSPSTLASNIAALVCAACMARERADEACARYLEEYADFLESHVEAWTVTRGGFLVPGITRHYVRINPIDPDQGDADEDPDHKTVTIRNQPPDAQGEFPVAEIVDAGFLELVRYGIRKPGDPLVEQSLRVVDAVLKTEFPGGPCWRRYTHDGYGQRDDGGPYEGWGRGRPWPLLTGERGHYELAAGRDPKPYIRALESFATAPGLLCEQLWDGPDIPEKLMRHGRPTGSAMPLMWAHAEYVKLLRSTADRSVFDLIAEVAERYQSGTRRPLLEIWKKNRRIRKIAPGTRLRIQADAPFMLHWSKDEWNTLHDTHSATTSIGVDFVDIDIAPADRAPLRFTFLWVDEGTWEGSDYSVEIDPAAKRID